MPDPMERCRNCEVRAAWYKLAIAAGDEVVIPGASSFLEEQGRMKYVRPIYR